MIIFLYGEDTYRLKRKLNEIINEYKQKKKGLNFKVFDAKTSDFGDFFLELRQNSIFSEKKFLIIKNIFNNKFFKEKLEKNAKILLDRDNVIIFCQEGKILKNDPFFCYLSKNAKVQEFGLLLENKIEAWMKKEFSSFGLSISRAAAGKLILYVGNDLWQLSNEIQKLVDHNVKKEIAPQDIDLLVKPKIETDIFKTIDALAQKNKKQALKLIHDHLEKGDSHFYLLSMINYQFRNLLIVKAFNEKNLFGQDMTKHLELHPYVLRKTLQLSRGFTLKELKKIYRKIFQIDFEIKKGKLDPLIALDLLIAEI